MIERFLIDKYAGSYPRYTSYPTALRFEKLESDVELKEVFDDSGIASQYNANLALYIHLPYCPSLCYFCACNKIISNRPEQNMEYLALLDQELNLWKDFLPDRHSITELHLGGGSPSFLSTFELSKLSEYFSKLNVKSETEKSIEVDPRTFDSAKLNLLYKLGFRRFSLGVQDFDLKVQKTINRIQPHELTANLVKEIRLYRGTAINFDLIYGLPEQTLGGLQETIRKVIELRPDRIALYGYAHVNWRTKVQNVFQKNRIPDVHERAEFFIHALGMLERAGYIYIGLDHFALPSDGLVEALNKGELKRNFMGYTKSSSDSLIAVGVSSISDFKNGMFQNTTSMDQYKLMLESDRFPVERIIKRSEDDQIRAFIIERIMCQRKISLDELCERFLNASLCRSIYISGCTRLSSMQDEGLLNISTDEILINPRGNYFLRQIASAFDLYLPCNQQENAYSSV